MGKYDLLLAINQTLYFTTLTYKPDVTLIDFTTLSRCYPVYLGIDTAVTDRYLIAAMFL
jgi:hypothetical protein